MKIVIQDPTNTPINNIIKKLKFFFGLAAFLNFLFVYLNDLCVSKRQKHAKVRHLIIYDLLKISVKLRNI